MKKVLFNGLGSALMIIIGLALYAFLNTWGKTNLEIRIRINEKLVHESNFGESPTFAIWLENPETNKIRPVYVTYRAAENDWEGKAEIPVALPKWFEIQKVRTNSGSNLDDVDGYSGATPEPGYFTVNANLDPDSKWIYWIEVNLAGDFNEYYPINIEGEHDMDEFLSGQPAILYRSEEFTAIIGKTVKVSVVGMTISGSANGNIIQPLKGITTATEILDEIRISVVKPKPRIIQKKVLMIK